MPMTNRPHNHVLSKAFFSWLQKNWWSLVLPVPGNTGRDIFRDLPNEFINLSKIYEKTKFDKII
jgi:hypothetical protein